MSAESSWEYQTREVTGETEDEILLEAGSEGWEITDLGRMTLHFRRPRDTALHLQWDYLRRSGTVDASARQRLLDAGWHPAAHSAAFHYFKRPRVLNSPRTARDADAGSQMVEEPGPITAQFALYPLRSTHLTPILDDAIAAARSTGASVEASAMSSIILGTPDQVFGALQAAFAVAAASGEAVLIVTVSNGCPVS